MLNFLIARLSASLQCRRRTQLGFLHHNASHIFNSFSSVVKLSESNQLTQKQEGNESFTVSYLMKSCGLTAKLAIEISKRVKLKDPENPDSVLNILKTYGFSETQISKLVKKFPSVLLAKPEKTLLPKLRFIRSIGFSCSELPELLISNCRILTWSLEERIIPGYEAVKSVLDDDGKVYMAIKRSGFYFLHHGVMNMVPNIKFLREQGVSQSSVSLLLTSYTGAAFCNHAKFDEYVKFAKEIGIEPVKARFIEAIYVLAGTKKSTWESKLNIFQSCGWSRDVTLLAFSKYPNCMKMSKENIISSMKFLVDEMGLSLEDIAGCPTILSYSLKQRIIPRWSVVRILKMKGLIKNDLSLISIITHSEKRFMEKFVIRFQESVPQLLQVYGGQFRPSPEVQV